MPKTPRLRPRKRPSTRREGDSAADALSWLPNDLSFDLDDLIGSIVGVLLLVVVAVLLVTSSFRWSR